jgi:hypothetical protein
MFFCKLLRLVEPRLLNRERDFVEGLAWLTCIPANVAAEPLFPPFVRLFVAGVHGIPVAERFVPAAVHAGHLMNRGGRLEDTAGDLLCQFYDFILIGHRDDSHWCFMSF